MRCGQCIGCKLEHTRQWAVRCYHEASLYEYNCFLTLTYDDEHLPWDHSLTKIHFVKFMKRFRKRYGHKRIRFYHSGEYGKPTPDNDFIARPHHHAIIFNHDFKDKKYFYEKEGIILYTSDVLDGLWTHGHCSIGDVTFQSAAYVARYVMKKINGDAAAEHYTRTDHITGEQIHIEPEYSTMSRRPGIGAEWIKKYHADCYPSDSITVRGVQQSLPRYYDDIYQLDFPVEIERIKQARKQSMRKHLKDNTPDRLLVRETVKIEQTKSLIRTL